MGQPGQSTASLLLDAHAEDADSRSEDARFKEDEEVSRYLAEPHVVTTTPFRGMGAPDTVSSRLHSANRVDFPPVNFSPPARPAPSRATLHALQEWEGHVVDIGEDGFVARLVDLTAGRIHESHEATVPMAEISEHDASRMVVGSIFRWVIGYERSPAGTRKRISQIVFRDLPRITEADMRQGEEWAHKVAPALNP